MPLTHFSPQSGIASDRNGALIATAGYDNRVILWEALTKKSLALGYHDHLANHVRFSPDNTYLVSSGSDHTARVWTLPNLKLAAVLLDHKDDVEMASISPDSTRIATASRDGLVRVFYKDGRLLKVLAGHSADVISAEWSADGSKLLSSGDDGTVRVWDAQSYQLIQTHSFNNVETDTLAITPGVIFAGNDRGEIIPLIDGRPSRPKKAHESGVKRLIYDQRSRLLISLSYDRTLRVFSWDAPAAQLIEIHSAAYPSAVWARSGAMVGGRYLALGTFGSTYALFDFKEKTWDLSRLDSTVGRNTVLSIQSGVYSVGDAGTVFKDNEPVSQLPSLCNFLVEDGVSLISGGQDGCVYDALRGKVLYQHSAPLNCAVAWSTDSALKMILIGTYTGEALLFCRKGSEFIFIRKIQIHSNAIKGLSVGGSTIMSVSATAEAAWLNRSDLTGVRRIPDAHSKIANACAFVPNLGFASVSRDLCLRLWNENGELLWQGRTPQSFSCKCVAASSDGRYVAVGTYGGYICLFDVATKQWQTVMRPTTSGISQIHFDSHGFVGFLASSYDGSIYEISLSGEFRCAA